jgi:hypothetical protein
LIGVKVDLYFFPLNTNIIGVHERDAQILEHLRREIRWNSAIITALNNNSRQEMCKHLGGNQKVGMFISLTAHIPQANFA